MRFRRRPEGWVESVQRIAEYAARERISLWDAGVTIARAGSLRGKARGGLSEFVDAIEVARHGLANDKPMVETIQSLMESVTLLPKGDDEGLTQEESQKAENIARLLTDMSSWQSRRPDDGLGMYLEEIKLISDTDEGEDSPTRSH